MIPLAQLFAEIPLPVRVPVPDLVIGGISLDSRRIKPGDLFVALVGDNMDGHRFIPDAVSRGAAAVVGTHAKLEVSVPYIQVPDGRKALAHLAAAFHGFPARYLTVIGVTGTDGKTSTCNLIYEILKAAGKNTGLVSTVNALIGDDILDTGFHVTTPEAPDVQDYLARMVSAGMDAVILEATSHGLAQERLASCDFDVGVVTNITHEHLDYHGNYAAYRAAKARLFETLAETSAKKHNPPRVAVLNRDDDYYEYLAKRTAVHQVTYGRHSTAQVRLEGVTSHPGGQQFSVVGPDDIRYVVKTPLPGDFNLGNCMAAFATTVYGLGISPEAALAGIAAVKSIPGRMERLDLGQAFFAYVDFAHTPNALQNVLKTVREYTDGRVIAVFGSAGLRDQEKRRMMAEISAGLADVTILTAEDPRTESLEVNTFRNGCRRGSGRRSRRKKFLARP